MSVGVQLFLCHTVRFVVKHCKAKMSRDFKNGTKDIKYYLPKARLHALYNKQHKKKVFFFFCFEL